MKTKLFILCTLILCICAGEVALAGFKTDQVEVTSKLTMSDNSTIESAIIPLSLEASNLLGGNPFNVTSVATQVNVNSTPIQLTLNASGTWMIIAGTTANYIGATVDTPNYYILNLVRTNNSPGTLSTGSAVLLMEAGTTMTKGLGNLITSAAIYETTNSNDTIALYGSVQANASAGLIQVVGSSMTALKVKD